MITTAQIRGARGILGWSQGDLAERTDISATSIGSIENGITQARTSTLEIIQRTFEDAGIEFLASDGIRKKSVEIDIFRGKEGFIEFFDLLYQTISNWEGEICISNVDENLFLKWAGDTAYSHMARVANLTKINYKVILKNGDKNFAASKYVEYRWAPENSFHSVPFYVFEKKLAIFVFDEQPIIILHHFPAIAEAYKSQFMALWQFSTPVSLVDSNGGN